jgi:hypothetical protein
MGKLFDLLKIATDPKKSAVVTKKTDKTKDLKMKPDDLDPTGAKSSFGAAAGGLIATEAAFLGAESLLNESSESNDESESWWDTFFGDDDPSGSSTINLTKAQELSAMAVLQMSVWSLLLKGPFQRVRNRLITDGICKDDVEVAQVIQKVLSAHIDRDMFIAARSGR